MSLFRTKFRYLDCILFYGQRDLFVQEYAQISVYSIFKTLDMDPNNGGNYSHFHRDMKRAFALSMDQRAHLNRKVRFDV